MRENTRPTKPLQRHFRDKVRPASPKTPILGCFQRDGRTLSRTWRSNVATMQPPPPLQPLTQASVKPPSPLLAHEQQALKPTRPLQPKNTPKTPISHPQRRRRFQLAHLTGPQRRRRFQPHTDTSEQRRQGFQHKQQIGAQQRHRFHSTSIGLIIPNQVVPAILHLEPYTRKNSSSAP